MLSPDEGKFLLKLARKAIKTYLTQRILIKSPSNTPVLLKEEIGAFVTLLSKGNLRGCIGYPEPVKPLVNAVIEVAISAATGDPRFPPVKLDELDGIKIEVSVLTKPEVIEVKKPRNYLDKIKIGEDGLIIEMGTFKGLLLPQVPVEWQWNVEEFLCNTCMKAGLPPDCWLQEGVKIYKFKTQIFEE